MHVAGAIHYVEDLSRLGQMRGQGVVRGVLRVMRVEAPSDTLGTLTGADDRSVHIECHASERTQSPRLERHVAKHLTQGFSIRVRHRLEPTRESPHGRQATDSRKAPEDRIGFQLAQVSPPPPSD